MAALTVPCVLIAASQVIPAVRGDVAWAERVAWAALMLAAIAYGLSRPTMPWQAVGWTICASVLIRIAIMAVRERAARRAQESSH